MDSRNQMNATLSQIQAVCDKVSIAAASGVFHMVDRAYQASPLFFI